MLDVAIRFLGDQLNQYLRSRGLSSDQLGEVVLGPLVDDAGKWVLAPDRVGLTLINVEEERVLRAERLEVRSMAGTARSAPPQLKLNLTILFHTRPSTGNYEQSLAFLSNVMTWFQMHPVFVPEEFPSLDARIEKLVVELQSYSPEQLNQLWTYLGSKYLSSVVYRVRLVSLAGTEVDAVRPLVLEVDAPVGTRPSGLGVFRGTVRS